MSKLERLLKLLAVLLDTEYPLSAEQIRQRLGGYPDNDASFRRAFERDKDDLRSMGVVISVEPVLQTEPPIDGYTVHRDAYAGKDPGLDVDELAALHLAAALVRVDTLGDDAFWKLGGNTATDDAEAETQTPIGGISVGDDAGTLNTAIDERRIATFDYDGTHRELEPARMSFMRGNWYVSGHDRARDAERVFRLDRITGEIDLGKPGSFERQPARGPEVVRIWEFGDDEPIVAKVHIDAEAALWARVHLRDDEREDQPDGSVIVTAQVTNVDGFRDWVLSFLDRAVVLEPDSMRSVITEWLQSVKAAS